MTHFTFSLHLSTDEYQRFYRGEAKNIIVMSDQGASVLFPASAVRPFVAKDGVHGRFVITMDKNNKLVNIQQLVS